MHALILMLTGVFAPNLPVPMILADPVGNATPDLNIQPQSVEDRPFSLGLGYTRLKGALGRFSFDRGGLVLNLGFDTKKFSLFGRVTTGPIACEFKETSESISLKGAVHSGSPWLLDGPPSVGGGIGIPLKRVGPHLLMSHFEFDASLGRTRFLVDKVEGTLGTMTQDATDEIRKRTAISFMWSRLTLGLTYSLHLGHFSRYLDGFSPFITVGDGLFNASLDIEPTDDTRQLLTHLGFNESLNHVLAESIPNAAFGFTYRPPILDRRFTLSAEGMVIPINDEFLMTYTGLLSVEFGGGRPRGTDSIVSQPAIGGRSIARHDDLLSLIRPTIMVGYEYLPVVEEGFRLISHSAVFTADVEIGEDFAFTFRSKKTSATANIAPPSNVGTVETRLNFPFQSTIGIGARWLPFQLGQFKFGGIVDFEFPISENEEKLTVIVPKEGSMPMGATTTFHDGASGRYNRRHAVIGATLSLDLGPLKPWLDIGAIHEVDRIIVSFDKSTSDAFNKIGVTPRNFYVAQETAFHYLAGFDLELGHWFRIMAAGSTLPKHKGWQTIIEAHVGFTYDFK